MVKAEFMIGSYSKADQYFGSLLTLGNCNSMGTEGDATNINFLKSDRKYKIPLPLFP
jgi:hypothetical protein